ncbi:MAG: trans-sulfuration enzyme family protein, partial [Povalibacter sp.]
MKPRTRVNHPPSVKLPEDNRPLVAPIYQSVKFTFDDVEESQRQSRGERDGYQYSRVSNPTLQQLQLTLAELQGRDACLLTASGVAAVTQTLMALCRQGDHVVLFAESYQPSRHAVRKLLARFGVKHTILSIEQPQMLEQTLAATPTRLVLFESPTNPVLKIADIELITAAARKHGSLTVLDNTFAGFHNHGQFDIDVFVHSLTKYAAGHGDVMGGAVIARQELIDSMKGDFIVQGATLDPHAAFLTQRGLKTYFLRYERQCSNAAAV